MDLTGFSLQKKRVLVTGSSSGIGAAIARTAAAHGASVIITGRNKDALRKLQEELGDAVAAVIVADLSLPEDRERLVNECSDLDGVVHCAGIVKPSSVKFLKEKDIRETFTINFEAPALISSALLAGRKINKNSSFVFISSVSANHPYTGGVVYSASKSALEAYSRALALEHAAQGIRSNCIAPAMVRTPVFDKFDGDDMKKHGEHYPLGFGEPADVANAAAFLLSSASSWITGTTMVLDGGLLIDNKK